jgi:hypothetical protein
VKGPQQRRRPAAPRRWCNWHDGLSETSLLVQIIQAATGPGGMQYACARCREQHGLIPLAERAT